MAPDFGENFDYVALIPEHLLRKHAVHQPLDTRFRAAARLLQSIWRTDKDLPAGSYTGADGKVAKLGSRISSKAARTGANFLTPDIANLAIREMIYREPGAMIDEERMLTNLLSSMPLTLNLLGPLRRDLTLATATLKQILPGFVGTATQVLFEHAPGRGNPWFTGDYTAFDAVIRYKTPDNRRGFVAFEIKYSESCQEPMPKLRPRYDEIARESGLFIDPDSEHLRANPLQQLWREHCLAQTMLKNGLYDEGTFVLIAPRLNPQVQNAAGGYTSQLAEPKDGRIPFINLHLEDVIDALHQAGAVDHAAALHRRYCDFWLVDGEIELALKAATPKPKIKAASDPKATPRKAKMKKNAA